MLLHLVIGTTAMLLLLVPGLAAAVAMGTVRSISVNDDRVRLRVPQGPMSAIETLSNSGNKFLHWSIVVGPGPEVEMHGPYRVLHN